PAQVASRHEKSRQRLFQLCGPQREPAPRFSRMLGPGSLSALRIAAVRMLWPRERWENRRESNTWHCGSVFLCAQYATDSLIRDWMIDQIDFCLYPVYYFNFEVVFGTLSWTML